MGADYSFSQPLIDQSGGAAVIAAEIQSRMQPSSGHEARRARWA